MLAAKACDIIDGVRLRAECFSTPVRWDRNHTSGRWSIRNCGNHTEEACLHFQSFEFTEEKVAADLAAVIRCLMMVGLDEKSLPCTFQQKPANT